MLFQHISIIIAKYIDFLKVLSHTKTMY